METITIAIGVSLMGLPIYITLMKPTTAIKPAYNPVSTGTPRGKRKQ